METYNYDFLNIYNGRRDPSTVHCKDNATRAFFARYLFQKAVSVFDWTLPDTWDKNYFLYVLYGLGYVAVLDTDYGYGIIPQHCTLRGFNVFYRPKEFIVTNPYLGYGKQEVRTIGRDGALIMLTPDFLGITDIVIKYADMMALTMESLAVNLVNSKLSYVFGADNKTMAESFKVMFDKINAGEPAVFVDKNLFDDEGNPRWQTFIQNLNQVYLGDQLISALKQIECMFDSDIGIANNPVEKKERVNVEEVQSNNESTYSKAELWLDCLKRSIEEVERVFPDLSGQITVDFRKEHDYGTQSSDLSDGSLSME